MTAQEAPGSPRASAVFSPLPVSSRNAEDHRGWFFLLGLVRESGFGACCAHALCPGAGTIGTMKYVYYGKHSEGNRFIRNDDL